METAEPQKDKELMLYCPYTMYFVLFYVYNLFSPHSHIRKESLRKFLLCSYLSKYGDCINIVPEDIQSNLLSLDFAWIRRRQKQYATIFFHYSAEWITLVWYLNCKWNLECKQAWYNKTTKDIKNHISEVIYEVWQWSFSNLSAIKKYIQTTWKPKRLNELCRIKQPSMQSKVCN